MKPPNNILITSDNNELKLVNTIPKSKNNPEIKFVYEFVKSVTKMGKEMSFTEVELQKHLNNTFKII